MDYKENKYKQIKYEYENISLDIRVDYHNKTVWLSQEEISQLFNLDRSRIVRHINNIYNENMLEKHSTYAENAQVQLEGNRYTKRIIKLYNLDMIISIGYRIKSNRIAKFKEWCDTLFNNYYNEYEYQNMAISSGKKYELVEFIDGDFSLSVNVSPDEDTVWLTLDEIELLFERDRSVIGKHIRKIYSDKELDKDRTWAKNARVLEDGRTYNVDVYNLDVVLSVGYRVNSKRGALFRKWASSVLKQYLLNGYSINEKRCLDCTSNIMNLQNKLSDINNRLDNLENTVYSKNAELIFEGNVIEPNEKLRSLFLLARKEIIVIDYYADDKLLKLLKDIKVKITIITSTTSKINKLNLMSNIKIVNNELYHDRFIIIDEMVYMIGISFNGIGKKRFVMARLNYINKDLILTGINIK